MKYLFLTLIFSFLLGFIVPNPAGAQRNSSNEDSSYRLDNPISVNYLKRKLRKATPRLILNPQVEDNLKKKLKTDLLIQNVYEAIKLNAQSVFNKPIINLDIPMEERSQNNQLDISRDLLHRISSMAMVYRMEKDKRMLNRINEEVIAACNFPTWFPKHFLDVAEMSLGIAIAVDWVGEDLPASTVALAKKALVEKGVNPSWSEDKRRGPFYGNSNWNQVCNGGMVAASIAVADDEPELAAKTIHRALDGMGNALDKYGPDGVYPEGATYWRYGTSFTVTTAAMFESAFGTDFGIFDYPGFKESAIFRILSVAPSGLVYNFADSGERSGRNGDITLGWFASKTGNGTYFEKDLFMKSPEEMGELSRLAGLALPWLALFEEKGDVMIPNNWKGDGDNPVVFFTGGKEDSNQYYFGGKGGSGSVNHGNMDGGSFVFELYGERWSVDPGNTGRYGRIERTGFGLWSSCQTCDRWKLLNKGNFGHSTLTVNNELHKVDGKAEIDDFQDGENPEVTIDLGATFHGQLKGAKRRFVKDSPTSLLIEDYLEILDETNLITWQLITQADVQIVDGGALLSQNGKKVRLENLSHPDLTVSVISLNPPPMFIDAFKEGLKRIEIRIPTWTLGAQETVIRVRLIGME